MWVQYEDDLVDATMMVSSLRAFLVPVLRNVVSCEKYQPSPSFSTDQAYPSIGHLPFSYPLSKANRPIQNPVGNCKCQK